MLRWAGSKKQILTELSKFWSPEHRAYHEPFCGSLSLYLHIRPGVAYLSDLNPALIHTYWIVRTDHASVSKILDSLPATQEEYYRIRGLISSEQDQVARAAYFIFLNRLCFNGLFRTNLLGQFNVPYGGLKSARLPSIEALRRFSDHISSAHLRHCDFESALEAVQPNDFVYLDPPYSVSQSRVFSQYLPSGFGYDDLVRLRQQLLRLDKLGATFVLSYASTPEATFLGEGFATETHRVRRLIAATAEKREATDEMIITNIRR